ncbi:MAG: prolipoprotein diacylglyceryl transferase [Candidatus Portnoybacteria bacterium]|nr:prolipoprotein diacylglyceryl transferase [Candidatus Portnoybacteria bacterium]MDD4983052.1 prolipoprotein diacylglyceryl transferase [Candidatus Portnoybacteria bacterium]
MRGLGFMIPYFVINQISLGPVKLYIWGLFAGLGFSVGYLLFYYLARKENLAPKKIAGLAVAIFFGAISGAWVLARLTAGGGAAFMGGLIGAILFGWAYMEKAKIPFWKTADLFVLPMALGIGIGRIGCILINDHQGAPTNLPWGILWPDGISRHPMGIYESLVGFGLLAVFWFLQKKIKNMSLRAERSNSVDAAVSRDRHAPAGLTMTDGLFFLLFLISYSAIRFFLEFIRVSSGPLADPRWGILSVSQWIAVVIFSISLLLLIYKKKC